MHCLDAKRIDDRVKIMEITFDISIAKEQGAHIGLHWTGEWQISSFVGVKTVSGVKKRTEREACGASEEDARRCRLEEGEVISQICCVTKEIDGMPKLRRAKDAEVSLSKDH